MKGGSRALGLIAVFAVIVTFASALPATAADDATIDLDAVEAAPVRMEAAGSVRFTGRVTITPSTQSYIEYAVAGSADLRHGRSVWDVDVTIGTEGSTRVVATEDATFIAVEGGAAPLPEALKGKQWIRFAASPDAPGHLTGPRTSVSFTDRPGLHFEAVGPTQLNGVATTRVHLEWPEELPAVPLANGYTVPPETAVQRIDFWLDAQGRLRREASVLVVRRGRTDISVRTLMDYSGYGRPVRIPVPDPAKTIDADDLEESLLPVV